MAKVSFKETCVVRFIAGLPRKVWIVIGAGAMICFITFCFYGFLIALGLVTAIALCMYSKSIMKHADYFTLTCIVI